MTYYKVLNPDGSCFYGGSGEWHLPRGSRPGKWMPKVATLEPCQSGYHVCRLDQLVPWLGPAVFEVEVRGPMVDHGDKLVVGEARLVRRCVAWDDRVARLFAADCAERALRRERKAGREPDPRSWAAVKAARAFANGTISAEDETTTDDTFQVTGTITAGGARAITEVGVFSAATTAVMKIYGDFTVINLASGDSITFTVRVTLNQA